MDKICIFCGKPAECTHHLLFGTATRKLADEDFKHGAVTAVPMCNSCHNMANQLADRIHGNSAAEKLSKMLGQAMWEIWYLTDFGDAYNAEKKAREEFMKRYGRNYL